MRSLEFLGFDVGDAGAEENTDPKEAHGEPTGERFFGVDRVAVDVVFDEVLGGFHGWNALRPRSSRRYRLASRRSCFPVMPRAFWMRLCPGCSGMLQPGVRELMTCFGRDSRRRHFLRVFFDSSMGLVNAELPIAAMAASPVMGEKWFMRRAVLRCGLSPGRVHSCRLGRCCKWVDHRRRFQIPGCRGQAKI